VGSRTDRILALTAAVASHPSGTVAQRTELVEFATLNQATGLLPLPQAPRSPGIL
jgi:hypothetical protein